MTGSTARPLRAGVVGLGMMGRNHVRVWDESSTASTWWPSPIRIRARRAPPTAGRRARGFDDPERMLAEEELDLVSIVAPTSLHLAVDARGVRAPAPTCSSRSRSPRPATEAAGDDRGRGGGREDADGRPHRALQPGHSRADADGSTTGELGRIFQISATRLGPFPARIRDVGVVVDLAPHDLDIMRFLVGAEPVRLYAEAERRIHTDHEDLFNGMVKFANGVIGVLEHQLADADEAARADGHRRAWHVRRRLHHPGPRLLRQPGCDRDLGQSRRRRPVTSVTEGEMTSASAARSRSASSCASSRAPFATAARRRSIRMTRWSRCCWRARWSSRPRPAR